MARNKMAADEMHTKESRVRLRQVEMAEVDRLARNNGITRAAMLRTLILHSLSLPRLTLNVDESHRSKAPHHRCQH